MSLGHSHASPEDLYYECSDCGYTSMASIAIGLCPNCDKKLAEQSAFA